MLQIWVDEVPLMPLTHGQLLANGKTCELPSLDQGRFLGFAANNGQGAFAKPLFRGLQVLAAAPAATVTYVETVPQLASRPVPHCVDGPKGHDCSNMVRDDAGNILQLSSPPAWQGTQLRDALDRARAEAATAHAAARYARLRHAIPPAAARYTRMWRAIAPAAARYARSWSATRRLPNHDVATTWCRYAAQVRRTRPKPFYETQHNRVLLSSF